uniref:Uncharacterized protein n=1 Tax=Arundo donax TaxID=35708 RepID=A0A0A9GJ61_ARUDO
MAATFDLAGWWMCSRTSLRSPRRLRLRAALRLDLPSLKSFPTAT